MSFSLLRLFGLRKLFLLSRATLWIGQLLVQLLKYAICYQRIYPILLLKFNPLQSISCVFPERSGS